MNIEHTSTLMDNNIGIPQGSILGAFLFIIYINDMPSAVKDITLNLFADDTLLYVCGDDVDTLQKK